MNDAAQVEVTYFQHGAPDPQRQPRSVIGEAPLTIEIDGASYTIMRTPGDEKELVAGFLFSEGLVERAADILGMELDADCPDRVRARIAGPSAGRRNLPVNSSCGLCGREDLKELIGSLPRVEGGIVLSPDTLYELPQRFHQGQTLFQMTGGSHAAALFDADGAIHALYEDLARHNAADKVLGHALLRAMPTTDKGLFLSGRASLEMILKSARARISFVAAISAPSSMAIATAERLGITLCGFVRGDEIVAYTHPTRLRVK